MTVPQRAVDPLLQRVHVELGSVARPAAVIGFASARTTSATTLAPGGVSGERYGWIPKVLTSHRLASRSPAA